MNVSGTLSSESSNNLIDYYPAFVCEPVFDANGNLTNASTLDLCLRSCSGAIDAGANAVVEGIETDSAGNARVYNGVVDIGAYEYQGDRTDQPYSTVVDTLNDSFDLNDNEWSLREAIYYAAKYTTITFADNLRGQLNLTRGELKIDKALVIDGDSRITIDAGQNSRVMNVEAGTTDQPVVLKNLTIQNGKTSDNGGGIYLNGVLTATNITISGNTASNNGGGVFVSGNGSFIASNSTISGNTASYMGGGVFVNANGTFIASNSTISGNTASTGGGVSGSYGVLTATNTVISGNTASLQGGGVYVSGGSFTSTNTAISGNAAGAEGGGVYLYYSGKFTSTNTTISGNTASSGGGVCAYSTFTSNNSIIALNSSDDVFTSYNVIGSNNLSTWTSWNGSDNIEYSEETPLFQNAEEGDYRLAENSQAFDKGSNQLAFDAGMNEDWLDVANGKRFMGASIDIGAYEYQVEEYKDDEYEPNDSFSKAYDLGTLETVQTYTDLIAGASRNRDWYKFTLTDVGAVDSCVGLDYKYDSENSDVQVYLYNASGKKIRNSTGSEGTKKISLEGLEAGTYYVCAYNAKNVERGAEYSLTLVPTLQNLTFVQPEGWRDSVVVASSSDLTTGRTTFSVAESLSVRFAFASNVELVDTCCQELYLDGELVESYDVDGECDDVLNGLDFTYKFGKLSAGTHTISVVLDAENSVGELDETDNERTITFTVLESKDDVYESNDSRLKASDLGTISSTQTYENLVAGMFGNQDWYKFTLATPGTAGFSVELDYAHDSQNANVDLQLYNASGKLLAKSTNSTGVEKISLEGLDAGTYYVMARNSMFVDVDVDYALTIVSPTTTDLAFYKPSRWSDSAFVAASSSAVKGKTTFSTSENVSCRFAFKSSEPLDETFTQVVELYLDGELVESYEVDGRKIGDGIDLTCVAGKLDAGEHLITVKLDATDAINESDENNNEQTIAFTVLESKDDDYESNDSRVKAYDFGTLGAKQTYTDLVAGMFANQDWYKFTLDDTCASDSFVELTYTHDAKTADVNLYLYNAKGRQIAKSTGATGRETISLSGFTAGSYYVKAYNAKNVARDVAYSLTFGASAVVQDLAFVQPEGWSDSVIVVNNSESTTGRTTFSTSEDVSVRFAFNSLESVTRTFTQTVYLDDEPVESFEVDGRTEDVVAGLEFAYAFGELEAGVHTITVKLDSTNDVKEQDENNNERSVTITVLQTEDDEYEPNDTFEAASELGTIATTQTFENLVAGMFGNQDWYTFTLVRAGDEGAQVELACEHSETANVDLYLYNASGKEIAKSTEETESETISLEGLEAGTYYLLAYNANDVAEDVGYSLTVTPPANPDLAFHTPSDRDAPVIVSTTYAATSSKTTYSPAQSVYLQFAFNSTEAFSEKFVQEIWIDDVLEKSYSVKGSASDVVAGLNCRSALGQLAPGVHTITVKLDAKNDVVEANENNNEYSITINVLSDDKYEPNDTRSKAYDLGTLESAQTYTDMIAGAFCNKDWYKFTLADDGKVGSYVELDYAHVSGNADVNLYLYNAKGKQIAKSAGATGVERISLEGREAGEYYLFIYNIKNVASNVDYTLTLAAQKDEPATEDSASYFEESLVKPAFADAALFRNAFEDDSFTPFEEEDEFDFVKEFCVDQDDKSDWFGEKYFA